MGEFIARICKQLAIGAVFNPKFLLSLSGAILSLIALAIAQRLPKRYFSVITLSILAAFAHIAGQLIVVRLLLIPHASVMVLVPVFALAALFFGVVNGLITAKLLSHQSS